MSEEKQVGRSSWISYDASTCEFPIQNLPYGIFSTASNSKPRVGVAIGNQVLDLSAAATAGLLSECVLSNKGSVFHEETLNAFMSLGSKAWKQARAVITDLLDSKASADVQASVSKCLVDAKDCKMHLPCKIGDYTDFYAGRQHAWNVGVMFRGADNALQPNWTWMPIGYHGRASSVVISGTDVRRPCGQTCQPDGNPPAYYTECKMLDFELEIACLIGKPNTLGEAIDVNATEDHMFGCVLMNDWSARDIQKWEYVPLGPFLGKNFATTVSPWVVTFEALAPFLVATQKQEPAPLAYLAEAGGAKVYDINLSVSLQPEISKEATVITESNAKHLYWSFPQMIAHHTVGGCNLQPGDMLGSGTISAEKESGFGSMLELGWKGTKDVLLKDGEKRRSIKDGDTVTLRGFAQGNGFKVGFGECSGKVLPANKKF
jgi:fumarylacetoacetase